MKINQSYWKLICTLEFRINNVVIEIKINSIKYLSFIIDRELNLTVHLEYIWRKKLRN